MASDKFIELLESDTPVFIEAPPGGVQIELLETDVPVIVELADIGQSPNTGGGVALPISETDVTNLVADLNARALLNHTHAESNVTNLLADLNSKAASNHVHTEGNITNLLTDLANKAALSHTHTEAEITNLVADLLARPPAGGDVTPPSAPPNFQADPAQIGSTTAVLTWDPATDNVGVVGYKLYSVVQQGGGTGTPIVTLVASPGAAAVSFQLSGLAGNTQYDYQLTAMDAAGNESDPSEAIFATNPIPDATAPTIPAGVHVTTTLATEIDLAWNLSIDTESGVDHYNIYMGVGGTAPDLTSAPYMTGIVTTDANVTGLSPNVIYKFRITAVDGAGNESGGSGIITQTTKIAPAFVAAASGITTSSTPGGPSCTVPAATQGGDLIMVWGSLGSTLGSEPTGFTAGTSSPQAQSTGASCFSWKIAAGTVGQLSPDAGATVKYTTAGQKNVIYMQVWRGIEPTNPIAKSAVAAESVLRTTHTFPDLSVGIDNHAIVGAMTMKDGATNSTTVTPPTGWVSSQNLVGTGGANQQDAYIASDRLAHAPTDYTGIAYTADQASQWATMWLVALSPVGATVDVTPPAQVTGFVPGAITNKSITFNWNVDVSVDTVKYRLYRGTGNVLLSDPSVVPVADILGINTLSYTDKNLAASQQYTYCITALDAAGNESPKSGAQRPTTAAAAAAIQIIYGMNCENNASNPQQKLANRNAANGWVTDGTMTGVAAGQPLVDSSGNGINMGMTRGYYSGNLPATWDANKAAGGSGVNTNKRMNVCFKTQYTFQQVSTGSADNQIMTWLNTIPAGWEIMLTFHHEPNNDWNTTTNTPAYYMAAQQRIGKLLQGTVAGQIAPAAKVRTNAKPDSTHLLVYTGICYTLWRGAGGNDQVRCFQSIPQASTMDPWSILLMDAYQNPPPPITQATLTPNYLMYTVGDSGTTPNMSSIWGYFFTNCLSQFGYDTAGHGYGVGEWMAPVRDGDNQTTYAGQAAAIDRYLTYLENHSPPPRVILMWENQASLSDSSGAQFLQWAHPAARAKFTNHACGPYAI